MREAPYSLLHGKTDGAEWRGRPGDGAFGAKGRNQIDGELLECLGASDTCLGSARALRRSRAGAKNHCGVWGLWTKRNWRLSTICELALRSGKERRRRDHRLRMLWGRMGAVVKGTADARLCHSEKTEGRAAQSRG